MCSRVFVCVCVCFCVRAEMSATTYSCWVSTWCVQARSGLVARPVRCNWSKNLRKCKCSQLTHQHVLAVRIVSHFVDLCQFSRAFSV